MKQPSWLTSNINLGNMITLGALLLAGVVGYTRLEAQVGNIAEASRATDARLERMESEIATLPQLNYRITASEEALKATNQRVDASLANISQRLAEINQALGSLSTQVAVLTQRLESTAGDRRAGLSPAGAPSR